MSTSRGVFRAIAFAAGMTAIESAQAEEIPVEEIVVTAHPLSGEGLSQAADVLQGAELHRKIDTNLGATLASQPGIHTASFGNAVGRPVIHGLSGPRVRIMEDRIDTLDVSVTSGDHAVSVEPFIAERIEVLKGSSALLYGSGAIGGVVDVHTGRIPHEIAASLTGGIESRFDNNTNGVTTTAKVNGGSGHLAWHADATQKDANNYDTSTGTQPGTKFDSKSGAIGGSYISDWGFAGIAVGRVDARYGLPGDHGSDGTPKLELEQTRTDLEVGIKEPFAAFSSLNLRAGHNNYQHQEIEPGGEIGTRFANKAWEARLELVYNNTNWSGAFGAQHADKRFSAIGEEAFIPPVDTTDSGIFWLGERSFTGFDLEVGARVGHVTHQPGTGGEENFATWALSIGAVVPLSSGWQLGLIADYASRAPVAEELYSNGPHLVTNTFERGNAGLDNERALNVSATLQFDSDWLKITATAYYTNFTDFIYQRSSGATEDNLPVVVYRADDATYTGIDLEASARLLSWEGGELRGSVLFDTVDAQLDARGNSNLPRTPASRYGVGLSGFWGRINASLDYLRVQSQSDVAEFETHTGAYNDLGAYAGIEWQLSQTRSFNVFVRGKNLTDDEQRNHTSIIKDFVPEPGRTVESGVRLIF